MSCPNYARYPVTCYNVEFVDLREARPREHREELFTLDEVTLLALRQIGLEVTDFIKRRYERIGFYVCSVSRVPGRQKIKVNLRTRQMEVDA